MIKEKVQSLLAERNKCVFKRDLDNDSNGAHLTSFGIEFQTEAKENERSPSVVLSVVVILRLPMSSSITIHLKSLHWLPVKLRSTYKIACLCYHCHSSTAPSYVTDMLHKKPLHTRNTRSSSYTMPLLNRPAHSKATLGDRSFSFASSSLWNSIPNDVRCAPSLSSFKSRLKTYLFRSVYKD